MRENKIKNFRYLFRNSSAFPELLVGIYFPFLPKYDVHRGLIQLRHTHTVEACLKRKQNITAAEKNFTGACLQIVQV